MKEVFRASIVTGAIILSFVGWLGISVEFEMSSEFGHVAIVVMGGLMCQAIDTFKKSRALAIIYIAIAALLLWLAWPIWIPNLPIWAWVIYVPCVSIVGAIIFSIIVSTAEKIFENIKK